MSIQNAMSDDASPGVATVISRVQHSLELGELKTAGVIVEQGLSEFVDNYELLCLRVVVQARQGRYIAALKNVDRLVEVWPGDAKVDAQAVKFRAEILSLQEKSRDHPYAKQFLENRAIHLDYPRTVSIETIGSCNAKCNFCPAPELERRFDRMSDELFSKVIRDLQGIPPGVPLNINTNVVNEPFMDKKMFKRLRQINEALPTARIQIYTNFNVLPRNYVDKFRHIRNLGALNISFNSGNKADYEAVMHIEFDRTVRHLKHFMAENRKERFLHKPVVLSRVADNTKGDDDYLTQCRAIFSEFQEGVDYRLYVKRRTTWVCDTHVEQSEVPYFLPCVAWLDMNIMCTGVVPLCCFDAKGDKAIGDVTKHSVLEIYNSPRFRNLRENHLQRESLDVCGECSPYAAVREDPQHRSFRKIDVVVELTRDALQ